MTWDLEGGTHTATAYDGSNDGPRRIPEEADGWESGTLSEEGASFEHTFGSVGVYDYYCAPHEQSGMLGSVIVSHPDTHGQPALEEPPEDKPERVREKIAELNEMCIEALGQSH